MVEAARVPYLIIKKCWKTFSAQQRATEFAIRKKEILPSEHIKENTSLPGNGESRPLLA
jgi:hypothetical protein